MHDRRKGPEAGAEDLDFDDLTIDEPDVSPDDLVDDEELDFAMDVDMGDGLGLEASSSAVATAGDDDEPAQSPGDNLDELLDDSPILESSLPIELEEPLAQSPAPPSLVDQSVAERVEQADIQELLADVKSEDRAMVASKLAEVLQRAQREEGKFLEITTAISRELNLEPLLQKIMGAVTEILDADRSTLFMHDVKTSELWSHVAQGAEIAEIRFPAHLGIAGSVFTSQDTINIPDAYADPRFNQKIDKKTGYKTDTILCMPVMTKSNEAIGVIQVLNKIGGPFTALDERRLRAFCSQASIAIENAQLFEDILSIKNYNESILQSMTNAVVSMGADGTIITANQAALRLWRCETEPDRMIGARSDEFFYGKNEWIGHLIDEVARSGKADISTDADVWLRQGNAKTAPPGGERRRKRASVNMSILPLTGSKRDHLGSVLMLEDITQEKRLRGTMARYMPKEIADRLLAEEGEAVLGGKLSKATVVFTDIRDFTSISEELGAQETVKLLNDYFGIMVDILHSNGGILDKYIGDAIMAVFGAPIPGENDADNAVLTAIGMMQALEEFNVGRDNPLRMGVGINTDSVLSGNIGSLKRMDFTVIGDGVNLASRLESANKPYGTQILMSEFTRAELKGDYVLREVDKIRVKGKQEPVSAFEVMDHHTESTFPSRDEVVAVYELGLTHYRQRDWETAQEFFTQALELYPGDSVSAQYVKRCEVFGAAPPPDDWDGVWTMRHK